MTEAKTDRAPALLRGEDVARLTDRERDDLERAARELGKARTRGAKEIAQAKIDKIAAKRHQRVIVTERSAGIAETLALAEARGEEVDRMPKQGAGRINSHDGLANMFERGHLTREQYRVGLAYREGFEKRGADLKAQQLSDSSGGSGHDNNAFVGDRFDRAKALAFVARCDREVRLGCISYPSAAQMLQWVAGMGRTIRHFGAGRASARNRMALLAALDVALDVERAMARERREGEG